MRALDRIVNETVRVTVVVIVIMGVVVVVMGMVMLVLVVVLVREQHRRLRHQQMPVAGPELMSVPPRAVAVREYRHRRKS